MSPEPQPFAPDAALPARDELLDTAAMAARFERLLSVAVEDCRREWARYEPGHSLGMVYGLRVGGAERLVSAHAFADRRRARHTARRAAARALPTPPLPATAADDELGAVFWTFPNDRKIRSLRLVAGPSATLDELVGRPVAPRMVSYAPSRAATARCVDEQGDTVAYAKAFATTGDARHALRVAHLLGAQATAHGARLRLPRTLAQSSAHRLVVSEALEGPRIGDAATDEVAMWRLGEALACFHRLEPPGGLPLPEDYAVALRRAAARVACGNPESAARAAGLAEELLARRPASEPAVCVHGDLNERNVILDGDRTALLDLDDVALGSAASDLGRTLAGLRSRREVGKLDAGAEAGLRAALLDGYAEVGVLPSPDALRWHTAATLMINRARGAVVWVNHKWAQRLPLVLDDVSEVLA